MKTQELNEQEQKDTNGGESVRPPVTEYTGDNPQTTDLTTGQPTITNTYMGGDQDLTERTS